MQKFKIIVLAGILITQNNSQSLANYNFQSEIENEISFQPADGSMTNGTYYTQNHTAQTPLHHYTHVIVIDGSDETPSLTPQGKYLDLSNILLEPIGSFTRYSHDDGDSDTYYLFGTLADQASPQTPINNEPMQTYNSPSTL